MRASIIFCISALSVAVTVVSSAQQTGTAPAPTPYTLAGRDGNSDTLQQTNYETSPTGEPIPHVRSITKIATGLNYWNGTNWSRSDPEFQISADGQYVYANKVQTEIRLSADLAASNSVSITTPDGIVLKTTPVAIGLYDEVSGDSMIIAAITNCVGELISSNQVLYEGAFEGIPGDVLYTIQQGSFSQDLIWRQDIEPSNYGFPTNTTRIQIFSAIDSPEPPQQTAVPLNVQTNQTIRTQMASPDFIDHTLKFGQLKFGRGHAFSTTSTNRFAGAPMAKDFETIYGQSYLVESVEYKDIRRELQSLPQPAVSPTVTMNNRSHNRNETVNPSRMSVAKGFKNLLIPGPRPTKKATFAVKSRPSMLADAMNSKYVIADYVALPATEPDPMVFRGDMTYFVDGPVDLDDAIFEGGVVVKYPNDTNAYIEVDGNVTCDTQPYLPAIFTAADDDSVGQSMRGIWTSYTGTVQPGGYANPALDLTGGTPALSNLRLSDACTGIYSENDITVTNLQVVNCGYGFYVYNEFNSIFENVLVANVNCAFGAYFGGYSSSSATAENTTVANCAMLIGDDSGFGLTSAFYNSILANVTNATQWGNDYVSGNNNGIYNFDVEGSSLGFSGTTATNWPFQTVGGGSYYLTTNCVFHGAGTANIDSALLADLAQKTTWPPVVYSNTTISASTNFAPQVPRDRNSAPDLGYHYDPIDIVVTNLTLATNASLTLSPGTALAWFGTGVQLSDGSQFNSIGTATDPCRMFYFTSVQEGDGSWPGDGTTTGIGVKLNGDNSGNYPSINSKFTKWFSCALSDEMNGGLYYGLGNFSDCEFYNDEIQPIRPTLNFSNCLFFRDYTYLSGVNGLNLINSTFFEGGFFYLRTSATSSWSIVNCPFDGTAFEGTNAYTNFCVDYNAYNISNRDWQSYQYGNSGTLYNIGPNDLMVTNYNWETAPNGFGDFYLPTNSPVLHMGSTNANSLGLYHFTTMTNQAIEGTNRVTIGYHYVATDTNGVPVDSNGEGIPDYIEDANGNGLVDNGETNWALAILVQPTNQTVIVGTNAELSVTADGVGTLSYQWYFNSNLLANATSATLIFNNAQTTNSGNYFVVVTNAFGVITSSVASLTVVAPAIITTEPADLTVDVTSNATFSVTISPAATEPVGYQWLWNGNVIPGATSSSITITGVQVTNVGYYSVIVTNAAGTNISTQAALTVTMFDASSFTNSLGMQVNGNANFTNTADGRVLELTPSLGNQAGSAFFINPLTLASNASFNTYFSFRLSDGGGSSNTDNSDGHQGADGITLCVQTITNNVGSNGGGLGYFGITNSAAVVFDTWYNTGDIIQDPLLTNSQVVLITTNANGTTGDGNHVGVVYNGYFTNAATFSYGIMSNGLNAVAEHVMDDMNNSNIWYAWIDYNGVSSNLEIRLSETNNRPVAPTLTNRVNLVNFIGKTNAYLGFTGGTGGSFNQQDILTWQFFSPYHPIGVTNTPPPSTNTLSVQMISPTNGQLFIFSPTNILLEATATSSVGDTNITVWFTNLTESIGIGPGTEITNSTYATFWQDVTCGTDTVIVTAHDNLGDVATDAVSFIVNAMPSVSIVRPSPTNLQSFLEITNVAIEVTATDIDDSISNVQFFAYSNTVSGAYSDTLLGTVTTTGTNGLYNFTWTNRYANPYAVIAVATDDRGSSASAGTVFTVTPTNGLPFCEINYPSNNELFADGADITITATAYATNGSGSVTNVEFFVNGTDIGGCAEPPYAITKCCWEPGTYQLAAIAADTFGRFGVSGNVQITVVQSPPTSQGFWDPTFHLPNSVPVGNSQPPADPCGNILYPLIGFSSAVYGSDYYVADEDSVNGDYGWTYSLYRFDGSNWLRFGATNEQDIPCNSLPLSPINAVAANGSEIYVAGLTNALGSGPTPGFVVYQGNGSDWAQLGDSFIIDTFIQGTDTRMQGIQNGPHLQFIGQQLYLFGDFTNSSGPVIRYLARWDSLSNTWEQVGHALNGPVFAIAELNGNLVVGGLFTNADGNTNANGIAELIGDQWKNLGVGVSGIDFDGDPGPDPAGVFSLAACGSSLYVGGDFTGAGNQTNANGIAVWNGAAWETIGGGLQMANQTFDISAVTNSDYVSLGDAPSNAIVYSISPHGNVVYVGGNFTGALNSDGTSVAASGICQASWNESSHQWTWSGMDGGIYSVWQEGDLDGYSGDVYDPIAIYTTAIIDGTNAGSYDVVASGDISYAFGSSYAIFQGPYTLENPYLGVARWRVGYSMPAAVPDVIITNPVANAVFTNQASGYTDVTIAGSAFSDYTNISSIDIYVDGTSQTQFSVYPSTNLATFSWTWQTGPGTAGVGFHTITVVAQDSLSLQAGASVSINVINRTNTPIFAGPDNYFIPVNSPAVVLQVLTNDTPTSGLKISSVVGTLGNGALWPHTSLGTVAISYDQSYLTYTPFQDVYGTDTFFYYVTNSTGQAAEGIVTVNIHPVPEVEITQPHSESQLQESNGAIVATIDGFASEAGGSITNIGIYLNGALLGQTNGPVIDVSWNTNLNGVYTFIAGATDDSGFTNFSSPVTILTYLTTNDLIAAISNLPAANEGAIGSSYPVIDTGQFDLRGKASAMTSNTNDPVAYQVFLCDQSNSRLANITPQADAAGFHEGGDNAGDLGTIDLTTFQNGAYHVELDVYGGGTQASVVAGFVLNTQCKVGQFSFSEQDLSLPVNGIPITVTRTYNSQDPNSADFGYGWTFAMNSMNVQLDEQRQNVVLGGPQAPYEDVSSDDGAPQTLSVRTGGGWDVTLTLPNGQTTTFNFSAQEMAGDATFYQAQWTAPPWAHATLTNLVANSDDIELFPSTYWRNSDMSFGNAPMQNQDFPGWILTTLPDKTEYYITRQFEDDMVYLPDPGSPPGTANVYGPPTLTKIVEHSGDTIFINTNFICHRDPNGNTNDFVSITRDAQGRITSISDPNVAPNGLPLVQYVYNQDSGNLIQVIKLQDRHTGLCATNRYDYNNLNYPHLITSIENGDDVPVTRNTYDTKGRLTRSEDADDNITQYIYARTNLEQVIDPLGRTNTYVYDANGNVIAQTNALNQVTLMAYDQYNNKTNEVTFMNGQPYTTNSSFFDPNGLLLSSTDPLGNTNGFTYNGFGEAVSSTDARGNTSSNFYDGYGDRTSTIDSLTNATVIRYNDGEMTGLTDPVGTSTTNYYDINGNITNSATFDVSGILSSNTETYDANNNRLTSTVWRRVGGSWEGATTTYAYDAQNRIIETISPDGGTNTTVYNLAGQQAETIDALGNKTFYTYDPAGHLIETLFPDGATTSSVYDGNGNRTGSTDQEGRVTQFRYDALNRLTNTIYPDLTTSASLYDDVGRVTEIIDARGTITTNVYDPSGRRIAVINAFGILAVENTNSYSYDANGNQITFTDPNGHTTTNVYDVLNRQVQVQYPDGTATETVFDEDGRSVAQINQDNVTNEFGYDGSGRLISVTNAVGTAQLMVTRYQYDEAGNEVTQVDALLRTNTYAYDGMGRRIRHMMPGGQAEGFGFDVDGNQICVTNFNDAVITNLYDTMNRLIARVYPNGTSNTFTYTLTGQRATMSDASGSYAYWYDQRDRLVTNSGPAGVLAYRYDANGNVTNITSSTVSGTLVTYQYDSLNRLTNVIDGRLSGHQNTTYHFDTAGNLQGIAYPNAVTNLYQYDSLNRLTNLFWNAGSTSLGKFAYTLGASGNRIGLSETISSTVARTYVWQYDKLYRLTNETVTGTVPTGTLSYQYDAVGNRLTRTSGLGLAFQSLGYTTNDWLATDTYDSNGNTIASVGINYQYDYENRLTNFNNGQVILVYDADGNRVKKIIGATTTLYLVDALNPSGYRQVLEELTVSEGITNLSRAYTWGLSLISQRVPGSSTNFYGFDGHGSTRFLTDMAGDIANTYTYDAFGNLINSTGTIPNNFLYCCYQNDPDVGLVYDNARYLNLNTGRFWTTDGEGYGNNEDPLSQHKYLYAHDNPITGFDPSGHDDNEAMQSGTMGIIGNLATRITYVALRAMNTVHNIPGLATTIVGGQTILTWWAISQDPNQAALYVDSGGLDSDFAFLRAISSGIKNQVAVMYAGINDMKEAQGVAAILTKDTITGGTKALSSIEPPGWDLLPAANRARAHLLAKSLGGNGQLAENLVAMYQTANQRMFNEFEERVLEAVQDGAKVEYAATPIYISNVPYPTAIHCYAKGDNGLSIDLIIENKP